MTFIHSRKKTTSWVSRCLSIIPLVRLPVSRDINGTGRGVSAWSRQKRFIIPGQHDLGLQQPQDLYHDDPHLSSFISMRRLRVLRKGSFSFLFVFFSYVSESPTTFRTRAFSTKGREVFLNVGSSTNPGIHAVQAVRFTEQLSRVDQSELCHVSYTSIMGFGGHCSQTRPICGSISRSCRGHATYLLFSVPSRDTGQGLSVHPSLVPVEMAKSELAVDLSLLLSAYHLHATSSSSCRPCMPIFGPSLP